MVQSPHSYLASVAQTFPYASRIVVQSSVLQQSVLMDQLLLFLKVVAAQKLPYASRTVVLSGVLHPNVLTDPLLQCLMMVVAPIQLFAVWLTAHV